MYPCQRVYSVVIESYFHVLSDVADEHLSVYTMDDGAINPCYDCCVLSVM